MQPCSAPLVVLDSLPIILKIVVLHGLLVARTMAKGKTAKARIAKGMNVSVKDVSSKVFLDRFPESANHKQQGRAHLSSKLCFSMIASKELSILHPQS